MAAFKQYKIWEMKKKHTAATGIWALQEPPTLFRLFVAYLNKKLYFSF